MMTTLQIVLAIVGIGMIGAIVIYNLIQERRFRKDADRLFSHKRDDIMLGEAVRTDSSRRQGETRIQLTGQEASAPEARQAVEEADAPLLGGHRDVDFSFPDEFAVDDPRPDERKRDGFFADDLARSQNGFDGILRRNRQIGCRSGFE